MYLIMIRAEWVECEKYNTLQLKSNKHTYSNVRNNTYVSYNYLRTNINSM